MSVWCVKTETETRQLVYVSRDGVAYPFSITLKKRLNVGEARRVMTAGWRGLSNIGRASANVTPEININWQAQTFARAEAFLTDWSLTEENGQRLPLTRETIEALEQDVFELIEAAITAHVEAMEQEKKVTSGAAEPSPTSV